MNWRRRIYEEVVRWHEGISSREKYISVLNGETSGSLALENLLRHAFSNVSYYGQMHFAKDTSEGQIQILPCLTKEILRKNFEKLKAHGMDTAKQYLNSSGGSSGEPVTILQDTHYAGWNNAAITYFYEFMHGVDNLGVPHVVLWGSERDTFKVKRSVRSRLGLWLAREVLLNSFLMSESTMARYVRTLNAFRPLYIKGYAGSLYELARYIKRHNLSVPRPSFIHSAAETLQGFMRREIEEVFQCKVSDFYGSREVGAIAGECRLGRLHTFDFNNMVEVVDADNRSVSVGEEGRVLVTTLRNYSMPMIRYEIGDRAVRGPACPCGCPFSTLERITGRITDHFRKRDGTIVHGEYFTHLFYFLNWVSEFQVCQTDYNKITIYYVKALDVRKHQLVDIEWKIRLVMGEDCNIIWHEVDSVPRTPQGKLLFTRSLIRDTV